MPLFSLEGYSRNPATRRRDVDLDFLEKKTLAEGQNAFFRMAARISFM